MNKLIKKIPQLRFSEFSGEWDEKKLGDIATFYKGKGISKDDVSIDGVHQCIRYGELYTQYSEVVYEIISNTDVSPEDSFVSEENDLLIPSSGETALDIATTSCVLRAGILLGGDLNVLRLKQGSIGVFWAYYLSNFRQRDIARLAQGNSVVHLYASGLKSLVTNVPTEGEQQKIAAFLSTADEWIGNLKQQKKALEQYKKGMMQKIFSQEVRFKDDDGNDFPKWKEKKVHDVFKITRGDVLAANNIKPIPDGEYLYPVYSSQTQNNGLWGYYNDYLYEDAITWTTDGANAGRVTYRNGKFYCTNVCGVLLSEVGFANATIAEMLNQVTRRYVSYVGNPKLMNNVMASIAIEMPSVAEQQRIADFLTSLDNLIESKQQQISQAELWKKGLLQRMFI